VRLLRKIASRLAELVPPNVRCRLLGHDWEDARVSGAYGAIDVRLCGRCGVITLPEGDARG